MSVVQHVGAVLVVCTDCISSYYEYGNIYFIKEPLQCSNSLTSSLSLPPTCFSLHRTSPGKSCGTLIQI